MWYSLRILSVLVVLSVCVPAFAHDGDLGDYAKSDWAALQLQHDEPESGPFKGKPGDCQSPHPRAAPRPGVIFFKKIQHFS